MNKFDIRDAIEEFETRYPNWKRYEVLEGFGRKKTSFRIYDTRNDEYINVMNAKQFLSDFNKILSEFSLQTDSTWRQNGVEYNLRISPAVSHIQPEYDHIDEDLRSRFGEYINKLSISDIYGTSTPFVQFTYIGNPNKRIRQEIKDYIVSTYQQTEEY